MHKFLGFLGWVGFGVGGLFSLLYVLSLGSQGTPESEMITFAVIGAVLMLLSGIFRRIFGIRRELVDKVGLWPAVLSRILCIRFFWSIFFYGVVAAACFFLARQDEGDIPIGLICIGVAFFFFLLVRHTCPRCGFRLVHDGDSYSKEAEITLYEDHGIVEQDVTGYYHCARCGKRVRIRNKQTTGSVSYR